MHVYKMLQAWTPLSLMKYILFNTVKFIGFSSNMIFVWLKVRLPSHFQMLGSSFSLSGPGGSSQTGLQVSSPILLSQRQLNSLDERKVPITLPNYKKPVSTTAGHSATLPASDVSITQKASAKKSSKYSSTDLIN